MIWVGIAMMVMYMTGDGNDARAFAALHARLTEQVTEIVVDPSRRQTALDQLDAMRSLFVDLRRQMGEVGDCIEEVDRRYDVTVLDYQACHLDRAVRWESAASAYREVATGFRAAFTEDEWRELERRLRPHLDRR